MELKKPLTFEEQVDKLISHGLIVEDRELAKEILETVNYQNINITISGKTVQFHSPPV